MKQEQWQQIDELLAATLELPVEQRAAFLAAACAEDETLRQEIESLLRAEEQVTGFMETPAVELAAEVLADKQTRSLIGQALGHYQILAQLGAGGMGEVYLAQDTKLHRRVALKLLPANLTANQEAGRRFLREARAAATLDHPHICAIHEIGEDAGRSFIVMQYVEGETLADKLKRERLSLEQNLALARQIVDALAEAHAQQLIHRDIKPANIIITSRGQAKVLDFGLAKFLPSEQPSDSEAETASLLSTPGLIVGTVPYMSPEQARGERLDARTDIFSFGTMLYEMLSGQRPFTAKSTAEIISAILTQEPPSLRGQVPDALERIVHKCLAKEPTRRYQTMKALAEDLAQVREEGVPSEAVPQEADTLELQVVNTQPREGRRAWLRSHAVKGVLAVVLVALLATGYALFFRPSTPGANNKAINAAAYDDYLRAKVKASSENPEDNATAIKLLEQVVKAAPDFAPAWAALARAYNINAFYFAPEAEKKKLNEDAEVAVEKALTLDPDLAEGHFARGLILWTHANRFPHELAIQSYQRALALNPKLDEVHHQLGLVYLHIGLLDKGWSEIDKTLAINPSNTLARLRYGVINLYRAKYEDAYKIFKSTSLEKNPSIWAFQMATVLFQLGRNDEATALLEQYLQAYPKDPGGVGTSVKAMMLAKAGQASEAEAAIQRAQEIGKSFGHFHHTAYNIASAYALLHQPGAAIQWLQTAADDGFPCYPLFQNDANLNSLRKDERFIAFMTKLRKQWEQYQATL